MRLSDHALHLLCASTDSGSDCSGGIFGPEATVTNYCGLHLFWSFGYPDLLLVLKSDSQHFALNKRS